MRTAETIGDDAAFPPSSTAVRGAADQTQRVHARAKVEVLSAASGSCVQVEDAVAARESHRSSVFPFSLESQHVIPLWRFELFCGSTSNQARAIRALYKLGQRTRGRSGAPGDGDGRGAAEGGGSGADGRGYPPRRAEAQTGARCIALERCSAAALAPDGPDQGPSASRLGRT